ncbi:MAG: FmdB family zinc ribbon protein, partial [Tepidisphaeraceae bacterium]
MARWRRSQFRRAPDQQINRSTHQPINRSPPPLPTYEYICEACEHEFEQFQSIKADPIKECPVCHKLKVRRKIGTGAGILFNGGGYYETDYRSKGYQDAAKKDKEAGAAKSESKADAPAKTE